jgi:DnaK suppressor protein
MPAMTKTEIDRFTRALEAKQVELSQTLRNRDGILIDKSPDALDEVQEATERELAIRNLHAEFNLLRNIRAALSRLHERTYSICQFCQDAISSKRLNAMPWVPYCIRCQETKDQNEQIGNETFEELRVRVA